jgi:hypothetical protein
MSYDRTTSTLSLLNNADLDLSQRPALLAVAFARAMAYKLPINFASDLSPGEFFEANYKAAVVAEACAINERCVFDVDRAVATTRQIWVFRYRLAHEPANIDVARCLDTLIAQAAPAIAPELVEVFARPDSAQLMNTVATSLRSTLAPVEVTQTQSEVGLESLAHPTI